MDAPQDPFAGEPAFPIPAVSEPEPEPVQSQPLPESAQEPAPEPAPAPAPAPAPEPAPEHVSEPVPEPAHEPAPESLVPELTLAPVPDLPLSLAVNDLAPLEPPRASFLASEFSTPRDSYVQTPSNSSPLLPPQSKEEVTDHIVADEAAGEPPTKRPRYLLFVIPIALAVLVLVVVIPVYFAVVKPHQNRIASNSGSQASQTASASASANAPSPTGAITGGDGSIIVQEDGTSFIYNNTFGGFWVSDPANPFSNNAQPNSWTPPLNTSWSWGTIPVYGVNLGGWFVLEPFITPALYQKYPGAVDEWTLSTLMAADTASGGLSQLEDHYKTFITEQDIAQIAGAGLNWIRLPIPFWAIETWPGEPFLAKTSWTYIVKFFGWARKYGLRVNLDLHTCPGSQNGFNHSGKFNVINFLNGAMGLANAQRLLNYIRIITEFISQPDYRNVVPMFSILNEPAWSIIGQPTLTSFYIEAYDTIRAISGFGEGNGPYIAIHDGFSGVTNWAGYFPDADRMVLDTHPYFAFDGSGDTSPISGTGGVWPGRACERWAASTNTSQTAFGVTIAGEFSAGFNDCGLFLHGAGDSATTTADCTQWQDSTNWDDDLKAGIQQFALASMDALQNWFFWTWKIDPPLTQEAVGSPLWSYKLGLEQGYMPNDPRKAIGVCAALGVAGDPFAGTYEPWQTGGGGGTIAATATAEFVWPPASIPGDGGAIANLPTYTPTGDIVTLPPPTLTSTPAGVTPGNGWYDASDTVLAPTPITGCTYPNAWEADGVAPVPCAVAV